MMQLPRRLGTLAVVGVIAANVEMVRGQDETRALLDSILDPSGATPREVTLLEDFIHHVLTAQIELAHGTAQALVESPMSDADLYRLVEELDRRENFEDAIIRAARMAALADVAGDLQVRLLNGRRDVARDPAEIERHIRNLLGTARARMMAADALTSAGEYSVPQLLAVINGAEPISLKSQCRSMLISIGRQAVTPLTVALPYLTPDAQRMTCEILEQIGYTHAVPALRQLLDDQQLPDTVRTAASVALGSLGGSEGSPLDEVWIDLAEQYWVESETLIPWPAEAENNIWHYTMESGLLPTPVPTSIYCEVMAMSCSESALTANADSMDALSLWIASNFRRDDQLAGGTDPTYGADMRRPLYYGVAAGPEVGQRILGRAIADLNTRLARHSIEVLASTAGTSSLWTSGGASTPLVAALTYPERRTRYDAALALARALPDSSFDGSDRVVPILASAIRTGDERFAAVVASDAEDGRSMAANLRSMGFTVLPPRANFSELEQDLVATLGIDLFMVRQSLGESASTVSAIQSDSRISASPVMVLVEPEQIFQAEDQFEDHDRVRVVRLGLNQTQMTAAIDDLVTSTMGELISAEEADAYAASAIRALRDIAVSNSAAFDVNKSEPALIEALSAFSGELRHLTAETLSLIPTASAQQSLLDAALDESDEIEQVVLLRWVADSARHHGNLATDRQIGRLLELVANSTGPVGTAAAAAHGALNLPASNVVPLIVSQ